MRVITYKAVNKGFILGNFNLLLKSGMILNNCTYMGTKDGGNFVNLPTRQVNVQGIPTYYPIVGFETSDTKTAFLDEARNAVRRFLKDNPNAACTGKTEREEKTEYEDF